MISIIPRTAVKSFYSNINLFNIYIVNHSRLFRFNIYSLKMYRYTIRSKINQ